MRVIKGLVDWLKPERERGGVEPLSTALERVRHAVRPGSLVLVISDFFSLDDDCNRHLSRLRQHNDVIGCQIVDPAEESLPAGRFPISDGMHNSMLDTTRAQARSRFDDMSRHHSVDPRRVFQRHQCGWVVMRTNEDPVEVLGRDLRVLVGRGA
jgi:hypothetical protein